MLETHMFNPDAYRNEVEDGKTVGFSFEMRVPYYRGFTLSILRDVKVAVDGEEFPREAVTITVNGETFTLDEARTVIHNRWLFGSFGKVSVKKPGGLAAGSHKMDVTVTVAPSYMPFQLVKTGHAEFEM